MVCKSQKGEYMIEIIKWQWGSYQFQEKQSAFIYTILKEQEEGLFYAHCLDSKPLLQLPWLNLEYSKTDRERD